jgi:hypothetical protein
LHYLSFPFLEYVCYILRMLFKFDKELDSLEGLVVLDKRIHDIRIEVFFPFLLDDRYRILVTECLLIGTVACEGVIDVRDGNDPGGEGNLLSLEPVRISRPVPVFVVEISYLLAHRKKRLLTELLVHVAEGLAAEEGVGFDSVELDRKSVV